MQCFVVLASVVLVIPHYPSGKLANYAPTSLQKCSRRVLYFCALPLFSHKMYFVYHRLVLLVRASPLWRATVKTLSTPSLRSVTKIYVYSSHRADYPLALASVPSTGSMPFLLVSSIRMPLWLCASPESFFCSRRTVCCHF